MNAQFNRKKFFLLYTLVFILMAGLIFMPFYLTGKSFVWNADSRDGLVQHYNALLYYGKALREIGRTLIREHRLVLPEYSFSLGMGSSVLKTLHYYVIGDPLNLSAALVPASKMFLLYCFLIVLRFWLAGLSFCTLAIGRRLENVHALLAGSMVYVFCGFTLVAGVRHPYFMNPMIYLPLILLGVHHYLEGKGIRLYSISVAVAALSNFYFLYMIAIVTAVYIALILVMEYRRPLSRMLRTAAGLIAASFLSAAMAGVILLPVLCGFFADVRLQGGAVIRHFYDKSLYRGFAAQFTAFGPIGDWTYMAYGMMTLAAVFLLFRRKGNGRLKILFMLGLICLLVPYGGHVMNGFSYAVNRWCFAFSLLCAFILVKMWPALFSMTKKEMTALAGFLLLYVCLAGAVKTADQVPAFGIVSALGLGSILVMSLSDTLTAGYAQKLAAVLVLLSVLANGYYCYHPDQENYVGEFADLAYLNSDSDQRYPDSEVLRIEGENGESSLSRYSGSGFMRNSSLRYGTSATQYFWSLSNPYMAKYRDQLLLSEAKPQAYTGFDDSTFLNALAGVSCHVTKDENLVPYGYEQAGKAGSSLVYHNRFALPLLYTYDSCYTHQDFDSLSAPAKAEAMMQGALLETTIPDLPLAKPVIDSRETAFEILPSEEGDVVFTDNHFSVLKGGAKIKLSIAGTPGTETILHFENISYRCCPELDLYSDDTELDPENRFGEEEYRKLSRSRQRELRQAAASFHTPDKLYLEFEVHREDNSSIHKRLQLCTPQYAWYTGRTDYTLNFGYAQAPVSSVTVEFPNRGVYRFDGIGFVTQPLTNYESWVRELGRNPVSGISFSGNVLSAHVQMDKKALLCLAVPYEKGWTAWVDGKKADLLQVNTTWMGIMTEGGDHMIRLIYRTPMLRAGAGISAAGWLAFFFLGRIMRRRAGQKPQR